MWLKATLIPFDTTEEETASLTGASEDTLFSIQILRTRVNFQRGTDTLTAVPGQAELEEGKIVYQIFNIQ